MHLPIGVAYKFAPTTSQAPYISSSKSLAMRAKTYFYGCAEPGGVQIATANSVLSVMKLPCMSPRTAARMRYADLPGFLRAASAAFIAASSSPAFTASMTVWIVGTNLSLVPISMAFWSLPSASIVLA